MEKKILVRQLDIVEVGFLNDYLAFLSKYIKHFSKLFSNMAFNENSLIIT